MRVATRRSVWWTIGLVLTGVLLMQIMEDALLGRLRQLSVNPVWDYMGCAIKGHYN
jgi:hypothetical protein